MAALDSIFGDQAQVQRPKTKDLKPYDPRLTLSPQLAIQRIARVYDERCERADSTIIDLAVIGDDDHTIR